ASLLSATVHNGDVVQTEKSAFEDVVALAINAVDPPREIDQQLVECLLQEFHIALAGLRSVDFVHPPTRPSVHRRIQVGKLPLVGGNLAIGMLELLKQKKPQILFRESRIDESKSDACERQVPGCEPGILPAVGHGQDAHGIQVPPMGVTNSLSGLLDALVPNLLGKPLLNVKQVDLLAPQHSRQSLPLDFFLLFT